MIIIQQRDRYKNAQETSYFNKFTYMKNQRKGSRFPGGATLYGRLG